MVSVDTTGFLLHDELPEAKPKWLGLLDHLSFSSLSMYRRCKRQFYKRYVKGEKEAPGESLIIGSVFHQANQFNQEQKIKSYEDRPLSEVIQYLQDAAVPKVIEQAGGKEEIRWDVEGDTTMAVDRARSESERITAAYHTVVSPRIQPAQVEQKIEWEMNGMPVPVIGYLDTITVEDRIIDTKTGKQVSKKIKPSWQMQGVLYANATRKEVEFHSISRAKTPSICTPVESAEMTIVPNAQQAINLQNLIRQMVAEIEWMYERYGVDEEWPANGRMADWSQSMLPCNFCGWRPDCPAWAGESL